MRRPMTVPDLLAALGTQGAQHPFFKTFMEHLSPQPWDQEFNEALPVTLAASASRQVIVQWPQVNQTNLGRCAIVDGVAMGVALLSDFDNIVWAVMVDGSPVAGYDFIQGPFGVFVYPKPVLIPLLPGQRVQIVASNLTAVPIANVTAYLMGRSFPSAPDDETGGGSAVGAM